MSPSETHHHTDLYLSHPRRSKTEPASPWESPQRRSHLKLDLPLRALKIRRTLHSKMPTGAEQQFRDQNKSAAHWDSKLDEASGSKQLSVLGKLSSVKD